MYLLARKVVEVAAKEVPWEDFQVGFHAEPSLQRLHLHVISKDFVSPRMKTKKHWNCHNTELFVPFDKFCAQLEKDDCFSRLPKSLVDNLLSKPLMCNQCDFAPDSLLDLKAHLYYHWHYKKREREQQKVLDKLAKISIKNTPPSNNQAKKPQGRGPRPQGTPQNPHQKIDGNAAEASTQQNGCRPRWIPKNSPHTNLQSTKQTFHQNSSPQQPNQNSKKQNHSYFIKKNGQNPYQQPPQQTSTNIHPNKLKPPKCMQYYKQNGQNRQITKPFNTQKKQNSVEQEPPAQETNINSNHVNCQNTNPKNSDHQGISKTKKPAKKKNQQKSASNLLNLPADVSPPHTISKPSDTS
ncbi:vacuolar protein-sorting-associated protein 36-like isoform X2 [Drosophila takahashii]